MMNNQEHRERSEDDGPEPAEDGAEGSINPGEELYGQEGQIYGEPPAEKDEFDYNLEPPLDSATLTSNRQRSKYVFMTLCFLVALLLFYTYLTHFNTGETSDWFPLIGGIALTLVGVLFLRSPDAEPTTQSLSAQGATTTAEDEAPRDRPARLTFFEELVQEALDSIPAEFQGTIENVSVQVEYEPDQETRERVGMKEGYTLLGLYQGVPLTSYGRYHAPFPEIITIYQHAIEEYCLHNPTRIREQVRSTVLHEVAHHFGMDHEEMPIWIK